MQIWEFSPPQEVAPVKTRKVEFAPWPRSATWFFRTIPPLRWNVPEPSKTYELAAHPAIALLIAAEDAGELLDP
jgi:hypothetical protein